MAQNQKAPAGDYPRELLRKVEVYLEVRLLNKVKAARRIHLGVAAGYTGMDKGAMRGIICDLAKEGKLVGEWVGEAFVIMSDGAAAARALQAALAGRRDEEASLSKDDQ